MEKENILSVRGISKYFPGVVANKNVDLDIRQGEIHALLGENGAGKTTLMNCVFGLYNPEEGSIFWKGREVRNQQQQGCNRPRHRHGAPAFHAGTQLHCAGKHHSRLRRHPRPAAEPQAGPQDLLALISQYGLNVDLEAEIWQLPVGVQQRVEIIKALAAPQRRGADFGRAHRGADTAGDKGLFRHPAPPARRQPQRHHHHPQAG